MTSYPVVTSPIKRHRDLVGTSRGQPSRFRSAYVAWREVRRINRKYRREQRQMERVLDNAYLSPNARQELYTLWATRN